MQKLEKLKNEILIDTTGQTKAYFHGTRDDQFKGKLVFEVKTPNIKHEVIIKAVLEGSSELDLEAILKVPKGAKNTDTYLKLECLLLSDKAKARVIPSLEIMEDAVKSGHGATVSSVNKEHMDYLMSRGLSKDNAKKIIIEGFLDF
ncbi:SufD family Fe-S cluster assembly protein [Candidatus Dojkabacteria bacterium]|nr:SufD family Fe-S cluster assembly protein [Candidatus Dojkabacteria bacterium]